MKTRLIRIAGFLFEIPHEEEEITSSLPLTEAKSEQLTFCFEQVLPVSSSSQE